MQTIAIIGLDIAKSVFQVHGVDAQIVDRKTRSKWCRVLRVVAAHKSATGSVKAFIKRHGGINACAALSARRRGRRQRT